MIYSPTLGSVLLPFALSVFEGVGTLPDGPRSLPTCTFSQAQNGVRNFHVRSVEPGKHSRDEVHFTRFDRYANGIRAQHHVLC